MSPINLGSLPTNAPIGHTGLATNVLPLGTILDWYPPAAQSAPFTAPTGWAICDGTAWSAITNDLGYTTGNIPDLTNKVTVGGLNTTGSTGASSTFDANTGTTTAPGVRGTGGNASLNVAHTHGISTEAGHTHDISHTHTLPSHTHDYLTGTGLTTGDNMFLLKAGTVTGISGSGYSFPGTVDTVNAHGEGATGTDLYRTGISAYVGRTSPVTSTTNTQSTANSASGGSHSHGGATASGLTYIDNRQGHIGVLKIMKVREV